MYVYVLLYKPTMSYYGPRRGIARAVARSAPGRTVRRAALAGVGVAAAGGYLASRKIRERRAKARAAPIAAPEAAPVVTAPTVAPPPPPAEAPMMTPETAPAAVTAPEVAPAMTPSAAPADGRDTEEVGNNTESAYMAEYPSLF